MFGSLWPSGSRSYQNLKFAKYVRSRCIICGKLMKKVDKKVWIGGMAMGRSGYPKHRPFLCRTRVDLSRPHALIALRSVSNYGITIPPWTMWSPTLLHFFFPCEVGFISHRKGYIRFIKLKTNYSQWGEVQNVWWEAHNNWAILGASLKDPGEIEKWAGTYN